MKESIIIRIHVYKHVNKHNSAKISNCYDIIYSKADKHSMQKILI